MSLVAALGEDRAIHRKSELRAGQWFAASGFVASVFADEPTAIALCASIAVASFAWYTAAHLGKGKVFDWMASATPWMSLAIPAGLQLIINRYLGADAAFSFWVSPIITTMILGLSVLRLQPWRPIAYAAVASLLYMAAFAAATRGLSFAEYQASAVLRLEKVGLHVLSFLGVGLAMARVARGFKLSLQRAEQRQRQRDLFGKYKLGDAIASGGMASVVRASYCPDGGFERAVAIKRIHPHLVSDASVVEAFRREAEIGARLAHPNIVAVLDFGRVDDTWFMALEHVDGTDLRRLLRALRKARARMPPALAGLIIYEVLHGLAYAHTGARDKDGALLRVVHRDLSPANVLIAKSGDVKVSDFGIACALHDDAVHRTQRVIGSLGYLSPEQTTKGVFDHRADVFAAGVLLWELLAGKRLWKRASTSMTLLAIAHDEAPLLQWTGVSSKWDALLSRALAKSPDKRFGSAREMADAVAALVVDQHGSLPHPDELASFCAAAGVDGFLDEREVTEKIVTIECQEADGDDDELLAEFHDHSKSTLVTPKRVA